MEPGERQLHLGLDACDPRDSEAGCLVAAVAQERRLANAGIAPDDEDGALALADVREQPIECLTLAGPAPKRVGVHTRTLTAWPQPSEPFYNRFTCPSRARGSPVQQLALSSRRAPPGRRT